MRAREGRRSVLVGLLLGCTSSSAIFLAGCGGHSKSDPATPMVSEGGTPTMSAGGTPTMSKGGTPTVSAGGTPTMSAGGTPAAAPTDECVPYADTCPTGTYCQYLDGHTQCLPEGDVARDAFCNDGARCHRGSICLYGSDLYGDSCQQPCSLDKRYKCDVGRHTCFVAVGPQGEELSFGVCRY